MFLISDFFIAFIRLTTENKRMHIEPYLAERKVLAEGIRVALRSARFKMIAAAAACVVQVCLKMPKVSGASVRVEKSGSVPGLRAAAVVVECSGDGIRNVKKY